MAWPAREFEYGGRWSPWPDYGLTTRNTPASILDAPFRWRPQDEDVPVRFAAADVGPPLLRALEDRTGSWPPTTC